MPFLEPLSKVAATFRGKMRQLRGKMQQLIGCILIDIYITPAALSPGLEAPSAKFSGTMLKFLRSLTDFLLALAFLCCHYIFDSYVTCLTLSFSTVYVYFHSYYFFVHL